MKSLPTPGNKLKNIEAYITARPTGADGPGEKHPSSLDNILYT